MRAPRTIVPAVAATILLVLSACGGGGGDDDGVASLSDGGTDGEETTDTTLSDEEAEEALLDWVACMRGEGIDMPDPQFDEDGGVGITINRDSAGDDEGDGGGGPIDRDAMEDATEACGEPPRMGGEFTEEDREEMEEQALAFAECMRDEGISDFPDPDFSDSGPGAGPVTRERQVDGDDGGSGAMIAGPFGEVDLSDPATEAAFEACQDQLGGMVPAGRLGGPAESSKSAG
jgi:hypothetical protein